MFRVERVPLHFMSLWLLRKG